MTVRWFADKFNPELDIVIYTKRDGESMPLSIVKAKNVDRNKYADEEVKDFRMCTSRPMARLDI